MNSLAYLLFILMGVIIYLLIDIKKLLKINEVDTYPTNLFGISKSGDIHPIIALGKTRDIHDQKKQWVVHVRQDTDENGESKPEIWTWPIEYYKAILGYDPRTKLNIDEYSEDTFYINEYNLSEDKRITEEAFVELKNEIFELSEMPGIYKDRPALPVEMSAAKRAFRFLLLMNSYNYLTVDATPGVDGTPEGGVILRFWAFVVGFIIEIPPEENKAIHYYRETLQGDRYGDGYSNNPLEVLHELIESGMLWKLKESAKKVEEEGAEKTLPPTES